MNVHLSRHHFLDAADLTCEGCGKAIADLIAEAKGNPPDYLSVCATPHDDAEQGQLLNIPVPE